MNRWEAFVKLVESRFASKHPIITLLLAAVVFVGVPISTLATFVVVGNRVSNAVNPAPEKKYWQRQQISARAQMPCSTVQEASAGISRATKLAAGCTPTPLDGGNRFHSTYPKGSRESQWTPPRTSKRPVSPEFFGVSFAHV
jgi:hypothetical protein